MNTADPLTNQRLPRAEAIAQSRGALQGNPRQGRHWAAYTRALIAAGHFREAEMTLKRAHQSGFRGAAFDALTSALRAVGEADAPAALVAIAEQHRDPGFAALAATMLADQGAATSAIAAVRSALAIAPHTAPLHFQLGALLSENGSIEAGFEHYAQHAALLRHGISTNESAPAHKVRHDREQRAYLEAMGIAPEFHRANGSRINGSAINRANSCSAAAAWAAASTPFIVIDDFLTQPALERMRAYCAESTVWHRTYDAGYIGATLEDGFASPLLAQIVAEIAHVFPKIIGDHAFCYAGAFKYDSAARSGTNTHADFSAINVNFYIAPDEANLDPHSGGMQIWDVVIPDEPTMRRINGDEAEARAFLERSGATRTVVPHRANRAIFFKSGLLHRTDRYVFAEGYLNKRINVSLLYGRFCS